MKKKTNIMRVAVAMLALTMITSCFVGGTFAKYTTSATGTDNARVAAFGVEITANGSTFAKEYDTDDANVKGAIAKSVVSSKDDNVVAPGTSGTMASMTITGTPEVAVNVNYEATIDLSGWVNESGNYYCPLEITVGNVTLKGNDYDSAELFAAAVKAEIEKSSANYAANADLSDASAPAVSWSWAFNGNNDIDDTYLGNQAAAGTAATVELTIATTVTQID